MIQKLPNGLYCISSNDVWVPGCFDTERAARYAFKFPDETLKRLQDEANERGVRVLTFEDLKKAKEPPCPTSKA